MPRSNSHITLSPLLLPENPKSPHSSSSQLCSPKEHSSPAESDIVQTPFLDYSFETGDSLIIKTPHEHHFDSGETEQHSGSKRSLSEGLPRLASMLCSPIIRPDGKLPSISHIPPFQPLCRQHVEIKENAETSCSSDQLHLSFDDAHCESCEKTSLPVLHFTTEASIYSSHFPTGHQLTSSFVQAYQLEDELGAGGYGFVMTAFDRVKDQEVAVKFIVKDKVPEHAWMEDEVLGRLPTEVVLLSFIEHECVVKCLDLFEDNLYFYLVQELHGSPWQKDHKLDVQPPRVGHCLASSSSSTPALSPSSSVASLPASEPTTPPHMFTSLKPLTTGEDIPDLLHTHLSISHKTARPDITRRPSHDLFECIEQSENKRLTEAQARYVFSQVVDAVEYLDRHGIAHRDIKDENLVIDKNLRVKLIDFGSAIAVDPTQPRPHYKTFYGTAAYASSEILLKKEYQAATAEIWTLGVLLSYLLAGVSPFPNVRDAVDGRIFLSPKVCGKISDGAMDLMHKCLDPNPETRATIAQIRAHPWLQCRH